MVVQTEGWRGGEARKILLCGWLYIFKKGGGVYLIFFIFYWWMVRLKIKGPYDICVLCKKKEAPKLYQCHRMSLTIYTLS